MGKFIVIMGVSGCGKTTIGSMLANSIGAEYLEGDSFHPPENKAKMGAGIALTDDDRWPWFDALIDAAKGVISEGNSAVLACSALKKEYRDYLFRDFGDDWRLVFLDGDFDLIETRMNARNHEYMTAALLQSQFDLLERPEPSRNVLLLSIVDDPDGLVSAVNKWLV